MAVTYRLYAPHQGIEMAMEWKVPPGVKCNVVRKHSVVDQDHKPRPLIKASFFVLVYMHTSCYHLYLIEQLNLYYIVTSKMIVSTE